MPARIFVHPLQLASINGFSNSLVARMMPFLTVANTVGNIDLGSSVGGAGICARRTDRRLSRSASTRGERAETAVELLGAPESLVTTDAAQGWRSITSTPRSGRVRHSEAVVVLLDNDTQPYRLLYVMDDLDALYCCDETPK